MMLEALDKAAQEFKIPELSIVSKSLGVKSTVFIDLDCLRIFEQRTVLFSHHRDIKTKTNVPSA